MSLVKSLLTSQKFEVTRSPRPKDDRRRAITEKEGDELLAKHAPYWEEHLRDGHVIDRILDALSGLEDIKAWKERREGNENTNNHSDT